MCCVKANLCSEFYRRRPEDDCQAYAPPRLGELIYYTNKHVLYLYMYYWFVLLISALLRFILFFFFVLFFAFSAFLHLLHHIICDVSYNFLTSIWVGLKLFLWYGTQSLLLILQHTHVWKL